MALGSNEVNQSINIKTLVSNYILNISNILQNNNDIDLILLDIDD